jgi:uncharacterized membrane-anchored protein YhcB (DUF1043 family)
MYKFPLSSTLGISLSLIALVIGLIVGIAIWKVIKRKSDLAKVMIRDVKTLSG